MKMLKRDYGITGQLEDLNFKAMNCLCEYAEFIKDSEDAVGRIRPH